MSERSARFTESVIREMTRRCLLYHGDRGINLAQGFPDFPAPSIVKEAARAAIQNDLNQYAITWGARDFREAIAAKTRRFYGVELDPEREITVCCGATEAMLSSLLAVVNPGDEIVVIAPYYENYWPDSVLAGATPRFVSLRGPGGRLELDELRRAFGPRTRAVIVNTPNNPSGKVFSHEEMAAIASLCQEFDCLAITDEIYEHLVYEGEHTFMLGLPGMRERTIAISGLSKSYSVTGWRVGYAVAAPALTDAIRKVHDFVTVGAPAPLQAAGVVALGLPESYYVEFLQGYRERRAFLVDNLRRLGFGCEAPSGAYYVMCDFRAFGFDDDTTFAHYLVKEIGVAVVPGSSFYPDPSLGRQQVRFSFCKRMETLARAVERLEPRVHGPHDHAVAERQVAEIERRQEMRKGCHNIVSPNSGPKGLAGRGTFCQKRWKG
ncbi:MAG: pyridoxal phosphate-dependent aminotransferase, partial [Chloroflexota bacterium]